ncbi:MAG: TonB-dependent receptor [Verrucomicrobia bacterium]|nr:MAG: TonB-dependent receptor [Verrucomicrobiota bacterium]
MKLISVVPHDHSPKLVLFPAPGLSVLILLACAGGALSQTNVTVGTPGELKKLSLEELLNIEVTSVSRRPEKLSETASAIQVITQEDIRRSGATSLPEALRLASNLQVAQADARQWAISARGFNNTLANKLLVMIDGRAVYTPLYAGVFWEVQNVLLEDVDRIEVVSGPGGTLWGANAVNGVINIITRSAKDTQGLLVTGGGGSLLQDFGAVRYGGAAGSNFFYRIYGQRFDRNNSVLANGNNARDQWDMTQGGFRTDWFPSDANTVTFQGDSYAGSEQGAPADTKVDGQNAVGRWTHAFSQESELQVQMYFDRTWRKIPNQLAEDLKTYDLDFQHRFACGERQTIVYGAGYRLMQDRVKNTPMFSFLPPNRDLQLFSGFVQDEITLVPERLKFTIGTKLEHNDFSGWEVQPSARLAWMPATNQILWAAISRAVRSPSRIDSDFFFPSPPVPPGVTNFSGSRGFDSENLLAYELGYRIQPFSRVSLSAAPYYNFYKDLRSVDQTSPTGFVFENHFKGEVWGIELSANYQATDWWRFRGGYNYLHKHLWPTSTNALASVREGNDPQNQFSLQSIMDLPAHLQFDATVRYVDTLPSPNVPSYLTFDVRVAWQFKSLELSIVGQNLLDHRHPEFVTATGRHEIEWSF